MKIVRFVSTETSPSGAWGQVNSNNVITLCTGTPLTGLNPTDKTLTLDAIQRYLPPVDPPNIFALGANYAAHIKESGKEMVKEPVIFIKPTTAVIAHNDPIVLPCEHGDKVDYEAELAVVIGKPGRRIPREHALEHVLGYTCANDVSHRAYQIEIDSQWSRGKGFDTFCPVGPYLVTDLDPSNLAVRLHLNGELMQNQPTADLLWNVAACIELLSLSFTLLPGTLILTGTPSGVGMARDPQRFLQPGDVAEVDIEGVGVLRNPVIAEA